MCKPGALAEAGHGGDPTLELPLFECVLIPSGRGVAVEVCSRLVAAWMLNLPRLSLLLLPLQEYFSRIMKKLKEVGATADRTNFYV
jgi:hypothetical protein